MKIEKLINKYRKAVIILGVLFILTIPAIRMLIVPGFYEPQDLHHFADIFEMARAVSSGQIPPRLGPDFSFNFGYPLFNFYYVLPFYIGAAVYFIFGTITFAFKFVFITAVFLSIFSMYIFLREFFSRWASVVGAMLFLYTPYRAVQIYVRGAIGEALALSLMPLAAWGLIKVIKNPNNTKINAGASLIFSLFILSHNYLWALTIPFLLILFLAVVDKKKIFIPLKSLIITGLLSLGISAYWWLPALIEQKLVVSQTPFPLIDHFPFIKQLLIPSWGYGASVWGPTDMLSFQIGLVNLGVIVASILVLILKRKDILKGKIYKLALWAILGSFICIFMMNIRSYPLWKLVPFHDFVQFPWRLLVFTTFFSSVLAGFVVDNISKRKQRIAGLLIVLSAAVLTFNYFRPSKIFYKTDQNYLTRFFANIYYEGKGQDSTSGQYLNYSEDYLLLPKWVEKRPTSLPKAKIEIETGVVEDIEEISLVDWKARITTSEVSTVTFNSYYFPGWYARLDGKPIVLQIGKPYGQIEADVAPGDHLIEFYWKETTLRKFADYLSIASLLFVTLSLFKNIRIRHK